MDGDRQLVRDAMIVRIASNGTITYYVVRLHGRREEGFGSMRFCPQSGFYILLRSNYVAWGMGVRSMRKFRLKGGGC